jgi:hypothetical protein
MSTSFYSLPKRKASYVFCFNFFFLNQWQEFGNLFFPTGLAAVLSHTIGSVDQPIAYASRSLLDSE